MKKLAFKNCNKPVISVLILFLSAYMLIAFTGCGHASEVDSIQHAETAFAAGDIDDARDMLSALVADSAKIDGKPDGARVYMRAAMLLLQISETSGKQSDEDLAMAARCFNKAFVLSADSAMAIISEMNFEEQVRLEVLRTITGMIDLRVNDNDFLEDSIDVDSITACHEEEGAEIHEN